MAKSSLNLKNVNDVAIENNMTQSLPTVPKISSQAANDDFAELTGSIITEFKTKTTLAVGDHNVQLDSIEEGISASGSPKLTFIFKDRKGGIGLETLSFGDFETSSFTFNRVKYLLATMENKLIEDGDNSYSVKALITHVDSIYKAIVDNALKNKQVVKVSSDIDRDEELSADDLSLAETEREIEAMKKEHKDSLIKAYNADMYAKYESLRKDGFQIFKPKGSKQSYALKVDDKMLKSIYPVARLLFQPAIKSKYVINIKQEGRFLNVRSITPLNV